MKLSKLENLSVLAGESVECDFFIGYDCLERRSAFIRAEISFVAGISIYVYEGGGCSENNNGLEGFLYVPVAKIIEYLDEAIQSLGRKIKVALDISCMSKDVMADLLSIFMGGAKMKLRFLCSIRWQSLVFLP